MGMTFNPVLYVDSAKLISGLLTGQYSRWGGVIRVTKGYAGAGQIVAFLREVPQLMTPVGAAMKALDIISNQRGHMVSQQLMREGFHVTQRLIQSGFQQTGQQLAQVLAVSSVGAMSSVLNLGVSAAGFYIMNQKLNTISRDVAAINTNMVDGFGRMTSQLNDIGSRLVELRLLALNNSADLRDVLSELHQLSHDQLMGQLASITIATNRLHELPVSDEAARRVYIDTLEREYLTLGGSLNSMTLSMESDPRRFMGAVMRYRGWATAGASLVMAHRAADKLELAASTASQMSSFSRGLVTRWTDTLMPSGELQGVNRFGHTRIRARIPDETFARLQRAQYGDLDAVEAANLARAGSSTIAYERLASDEAWIERQLALANLLDMLEESTERLESLSAQVEYARDNRIGYKGWEALPVLNED